MALKLAAFHPEALEKTVHLLRLGKVIILPTDTVYGLACCATNYSAIEDLYKIKQRNNLKPLAICLSEVSNLNKWADIQDLPDELIKTLLPGPVTLLVNVNKYSNLHHSLHSNGKIGIRIPNSIFIRNVVKSLGCPLALTSANLSGESSCVDIQETKILWNRVSCVIDNGILGNKHLHVNESASTIVDLSKCGYFKVIRKGISAQKICSILIKFGLTEL